MFFVDLLLFCVLVVLVLVLFWAVFFVWALFVCLFLRADS